MIKKILISTLLLLGTNALSNINVTTTIYPLYNIAKAVGTDKIKLNNLIPFGIEEHGFDLMEPWKNKIVSSLKIENKVFDMSKHVKLIEIEEKNHNEHDHKKDHNHNSNIDPHYWVSLNNYILMTKVITQLFIEKDPVNKDIYKENSDKYLQKIEALKIKYDTSLNSCKNKKILVNHNAFGYFADEYDVKQYSISGLTPESKPSAKVVSELIDLVKNEKINNVFFEEFASPKVAQTIAKAANVKIDTLRPAENISKIENEKGYGYLEIMEDNLEKLKFAMDCK